MPRWGSWAAMALVLAVSLGVGVADAGGPSTDGQRAESIAASVKCPQCRSQSALDSDSRAAVAIRTEIARRVESGEGDDEIRSYLVSKYGEDILLNPPRSGLASLVWVLPVAGLVLAVAGLAAAFLRWRSTPALVATDEDRARVDQARSAPA